MHVGIDLLEPVVDERVRAIEGVDHAEPSTLEHRRNSKMHVRRAVGKTVSIRVPLPPTSGMRLPAQRCSNPQFAQYPLSSPGWRRR